MSADPPLAVLFPLLSCQQIHLLQSCLHFCRVSRSTSRSPVHFCCVSRIPLQFCLHFVVSADPLLADLSTLLSCHIIHLSRSLFVSRSANPPLTVISPFLSCQQIHLSQSYLRFCHVSRSLSRSPTFVLTADPPRFHLCNVSRFTSRSPTFAVSADSPLAVLLSPL